MNSGELVNDKFVFKLLEDRLYASDCMINGWILTGFPKNNSQMNYFDLVNTSFKPSLTVIIELDDDYVTNRSNSRRIDPATSKIYYVDSKEYQTEKSYVVNRLVTKTEDRNDVFKKRLDNWKKFSNSCLSQNIGNNIIRLNGELAINNLIETISDAMENAS